jgi:guanylate cyclase
MESHGVPGRVQVTEQVASQLDESFLVEPRGVIEVKGKGPMTAFLVGPEPTSM